MALTNPTVVFRAAERAFRVDMADIFARNRRPSPYAARVACIKFLHEEGRSSYLVGRAVCRDHATVLYSLGQYDKLMTENTLYGNALSFAAMDTLFRNEIRRASQTV